MTPVTSGNDLDYRFCYKTGILHRSREEHDLSCKPCPDCSLDYAAYHGCYWRHTHHPETCLSGQHTDQMNELRDAHYRRFYQSPARDMELDEEDDTDEDEDYDEDD